MPLHHTGCVYQPHVVIVPMWGALRLHNTDRIPHTLRTDSTKNPPQTWDAPAAPASQVLRFTAAEPVRVACDEHPWMTAWVIVAEHPYYTTTDANGAFRLAGVPAGEYTVQVWHESIGQRTQTISVPAGEEVRVDWQVVLRGDGSN